MQLEKMFGAFRTTTSSGGDNPSYVMTFKFASMADMHAADDEWIALRSRPEAPHQPAGIGEMVERLREMGEHPCRRDLPMGADLRKAADMLEHLSRQPGEDERESFEQRYRHLDLTREVSPTWGASRYKHSHVEAIWEGWSARAALSALPVHGVLEEREACAAEADRAAAYSVARQIAKAIRARGDGRGK